MLGVGFHPRAVGSQRSGHVFSGRQEDLHSFWTRTWLAANGALGRGMGEAEKAKALRKLRVTPGQFGECGNQSYALSGWRTWRRKGVVMRSCRPFCASVVLLTPPFCFPLTRARTTRRLASYLALCSISYTLYEAEPFSWELFAKAERKAAANLPSLERFIEVFGIDTGGQEPAWHQVGFTW